MKHVIRHMQREQGQTLIVMSLMTAIMLGVIGLAIDGGRAYAARRHAQNSADASALAAAAEIGTSASRIQDAAVRYATANGYDEGDIVVHHPPATGAHAGDDAFVQVTVRQDMGTVFIRALGVHEVSTGAGAVAGITSIAAGHTEEDDGGGEVAPLGVPDACKPDDEEDDEEDDDEEDDDEDASGETSGGSGSHTGLSGSGSDSGASASGSDSGDGGTASDSGDGPSADGHSVGGATADDLTASDSGDGESADGHTTSGASADDGTASDSGDGESADGHSVDEFSGDDNSAASASEPPEMDSADEDDCVVLAE